jgi:hypothetical protein
MRLGRRLLALSLNVLLLHLAWTGSLSECAPVKDHAPGAASMAMNAMHGSDAPVSSERRVGAEAARHDCAGHMLGSGCGFMTGCATVGLATARAPSALARAGSGPVLSGVPAALPLAAPQPLPPPPRA